MGAFWYRKVILGWFGDLKMRRRRVTRHTRRSLVRALGTQIARAPDFSDMYFVQISRFFSNLQIQN
jgi:hypothetical protein